ncbi:MAG TPA: hypothetical protein VJ885_17965, partial [Thermoanaerobaculia bacterium]|nr:hypothetical protein [Thermoanaerobaculia bacterium]
RLREALATELVDLAPGKARRLRRGTLLDLPDREETVGRVLSVLAQEDFGIALERAGRGARLTREPVFRFRAWRFLHELRHPSPDKRQAFRHTVGRVHEGQVRAPSEVLAELAQTKVPGEPLYLAEDDGWRPWLPLPDDAITCLNQGLPGEPVRFYTSEGVTELEAPRTLLGRLRAWWRLSRGFAPLARHRNWREGGQESPEGYLRELASLGFRATFRPHRAPAPDGPSPGEDPAVRRFFPQLAPFAGGDLWRLLQDYFLSLYENSLWELGVFTAAACALFLGRHVWSNWPLRRARRRLPLVVGGWGTRGKSSVERLKASLFNALGYGVVSKTTGCEAMFLFARPFGRTSEMFLFRPYDKATIWEQRSVVRLADRLGAEAFLWECMGLGPAFVDVLQRQWMRDDLSTLTNAYPDHEDIQGPAGYNVAQSIGQFIPHRGRLFTTEEQMLPVLRDLARARGTDLTAAGWLEAGLIPPDILGRFSYEEHPYNLALVLALAREMGLDRPFALKEMADRVVPDLGVLKTYPPAPVRGRVLEFSMGMSANERHGCLSNWRRLGFDRQDPVAEPGVWVTTVVNNRADRVARSQVFARIVATDLSADRHFLIGGNLQGLAGYIHAAWEEHASTLTLWSESGAETPEEILRRTARWFRQPASEEEVEARLAAMLGRPAGSGELAALRPHWREPERLLQALEPLGAGAHGVAIARHHAENLRAWDEYQAFAERLAAGGDRKSLLAAFRTLLTTWFHRKIVVIENYHASGDEVVHRICEETPPNVRNRIMGIQNIKGTGLDFVYRWQAWEACQRACARMLDRDPGVAERGLGDLAVFHDYGLLSEETVLAAIETMRQSPLAQRESLQAELDVIRSELRTSLDAIRARLAGGARTGGWGSRIFRVLEELLDAGDAVRRRRTANQIYRDLAAERISAERTILELQALNKRQKGGWLWQQIKALESYLTQRGLPVLAPVRSEETPNA